MEKQYKILILEDVPTDAELVIRELKKGNLNFTSKCICTKVALKQELLSFSPDFILSDYCMPQFTGMDALKIVLKESPDIPFIIITGSINEETAVDCIKAGAWDYVTKENLTRLIPAINEALELKYAREETKMAEAALQESEEKYRKLVDEISDGLYVLDSMGIFTFSNVSHAKMLGFNSAEELAGRNFMEFIDPEAKTEVGNTVKHVITTGEFPKQMEYPIIRNDGSKGFIEVKPTLIIENGRMIGARGIARDITEHKRTQTQLLKLSRSVEQSPVSVVITDSNGIIEYVNPKFGLLTGYSSNEVLGQNPSLLKSGVQSKTFYTEMWKLISSGKEWHGEFCNKKKSGEIYWESASISPIIDQSGAITHFVAVKEDITARKETELELSESEQKYKDIHRLFRTISNNMTDLFWAKDLDKRYVFANKAICDNLLNAIDTDEPIGKTDIQFAERERNSHPENPHWHTFGEICQDSDQEIIDTQKPGRFDEYGYVKGKFLYLDVQKSPLFNDVGEMIGVVGSARDVTVEKDIQKNLNKSEQRYRTLFEESRDAILLATIDGRLIDFNRAATELFGYSKEELLTVSAEELYVNLEDRLQFKEMIEKQGFVKDLEVSMKKKDGSIIACLETISLRRDNSGEIIGYEGTIRDITKLKKTENTLKETNEFLRNILESSSAVSIISTDWEGNILYWNQGAEEIFGYKSEEIVGLQKIGILYPEDEKETFKIVKDMRSFIQKNKKSATGEIVELTKDGRKLWAQLTLSPRLNKSGEVIGILGIGKDITERKRAEKLLQYRTDFDNLITAISTNFINLPPEEIDRSINHALQEIGEFAGVDRSYTFLLTDNKSKMDNTHEWCTKEIEPQIDNLKGLSVEILPWWMEKLNRFEKIHIPRVADLPPEASAEKEILQEQDIQSLVVVPMVYGGSLVGFLGFDSVKIEKTWSEEIIGLLKIVGEIFTNALIGKWAEEKLRASQEYSQNLIDSSLDMIIAVDNKRRITEFNQAAEETFGYNTSEVIGKHIKLLYSNVKQGDKVHTITLKKGRHIQEIVNRRKNGDIFPALLAASTLKNSSGEIIGIMGVSRDITNSKQIEEALKESEKKFRSVIEQSNDGIYVLQNDRFVFINTRFTEIIGYELDEISGADFHFQKLIAEEGMGIFFERDEMRERGEVPSDRFVFKGLGKDGTKRDLEVSVTEVIWQNAPATLGILHDVTKRIQTQKELEQALGDAQQGEKVKSFFMANISHEIRTPLNAILGFTDLIAASTRHLVSEEEKEFFDMVAHSGKRLMHTVHEILDISLIESGTYDVTMNQLDLCSLVQNLVREFQPMAGNKSLKLEYKSNLDSAFIQADQHGITQAIYNIIDNAIKYTERGGITVLLKQDDEQYILSISDTGIGIAKEYLNDLFEAFTQESEGYTKQFQGIGLGMAIVKRHLDINSVSITVDSDKGMGTTFTLTFKQDKKLLLEKQPGKTETPVTSTKKPIQKPMILLVEDDLNSQKLTEIFLKGNYDMCSAVSVHEAKAQLKKHPISLILLDLSLVGDEDGLDLARYLRTTEKWRDIPIIALTAHAFTTDRDKCKVAGCDDYLAKPINKGKLLAKISDQDLS